MNNNTYEVELDTHVINKVRAAATSLHLKYQPIWKLTTEAGAKYHRIIIEEDRYSYILLTDALYGGSTVKLLQVYDYESGRTYTTSQRFAKFIPLAEKFCEELLTNKEEVC